MSIQTMIDAWENEGSLTVVRRVVETSPPKRCVMATNEVLLELGGPWPSRQEEEDRYRTAKAVIDLFIDGTYMAVRVPPSTSAKAQLALLLPNNARVWEFRTRPSKKFRYGVRVFGMFAKKDLFIAMATAFKEDLLDDSDYPEQIAFCVRTWSTYFQSYDPDLGTPPDAYLSNWTPC
jgi:hypothetical protein